MIPNVTPRISVVASVRGRVDVLDLMLTSLHKTVADPARVEVVLRCDSDDAKMVEYLCQQPLTFICGQRLRGYETLGVLVNEAARLSHSDLVLVVNDDAEFITPGWDELLVNRASGYPDGIFDFGVETDNAENFVFPCTSRRVIDLVGIHHPNVVYNDIWLRDVMTPFGRAIRVPEVVIRHNWQGQSVDQQRAIRIVQSRDYEDRYARCVQVARVTIEAALQGAAVREGVRAW